MKPPSADSRDRRPRRGRRDVRPPGQDTTDPPTPLSDEERRYQELLRTAPAKTRWVLLMAVLFLVFAVVTLAGLLGGHFDGQVNHARWFGVVLYLVAGVFFLWGWSKMRHGPVPPGGRPGR